MFNHLIKQNQNNKYDMNSFYFRKIKSDFTKEVLKATQIKKAANDNIINYVMKIVFKENASKSKCIELTRNLFQDKTKYLIDFLYDIADLEEEDDNVHLNKNELSLLDLYTKYNKPKKVPSIIVNPNNNSNNKIYIGNKELLVHNRYTFKNNKEDQTLKQNHQRERSRNNEEKTINNNNSKPVISLKAILEAKEEERKKKETKNGNNQKIKIVLPQKLKIEIHEQLKKKLDTIDQNINEK